MRPATASLPTLRDVIARHGLDARRSLGQHFLLDGNLTDRIARAAGDLGGVHVIEVGPGPGGLTRSLLRAGAESVVAVEKDPRCVAAITELAQAFPARLRVVADDALAVATTDLVPAPRKVVANLPYNVATPLLIRWLREVDGYLSLTLMFQKEVADRLLAVPTTSEYGRLSVIAQWLCTVRREFNVPREAFTPPPKVASTVVTLTPRPAPLAPATWTAVETVTAAAFGQRRKMLRQSLKAIGVRPESAGIDPTARAEQLTVEQFCALARTEAAQRAARKSAEPAVPAGRRRH
ncbi:MAG: 16S rRNA (adenine(1518)-N(6)/adenine(1519)-N(6))-dimethyltransferase RsmA [Rhodospirillales bacterium]|nr:MAG: 16S rRNA (adenine(1518)-N(6)/adenine(1519)-N(6))-dimethyltransferase RsmA [Rhodospirillales bacterium]